MSEPVTRLTCPECGASDIALLGRLLQRTPISGLDEAGWPVYAGDASTPFWDTAEPARDEAGRLWMECLDCDHTWHHGEDEARKAA